MPTSNREEGPLSFVLQEMGESMRQISNGVAGVVTELHTHAVILESLKTELNSLKTNAENLTRLVRDGNGQPSLVSRVTVMETRLAGIQEWQTKKDEHAAENSRARYSAYWGMWAGLISGILGLIGAAVALFKS